MITYQQWSKMLFMFNDKWLVDMYVKLLLASLNMMLIAVATCSGPTENKVWATRFAVIAGLAKRWLALNACSQQVRLSRQDGQRRKLMLLCNSLWAIGIGWAINGPAPLAAVKLSSGTCSALTLLAVMISWVDQLKCKCLGEINVACFLYVSGLEIVVSMVGVGTGFDDSQQRDINSMIPLVGSPGRLHS